MLVFHSPGHVRIWATFGILWTSWLKISSVAETLAAQNFIHSTLVQFPDWSVTLVSEPNPDDELPVALVIVGDIVTIHQIYIYIIYIYIIYIYIHIFI